jgi:hypothetical protein
MGVCELVADETATRMRIPLVHYGSERIKFHWRSRTIPLEVLVEVPGKAVKGQKIQLRLDRDCLAFLCGDGTPTGEAELLVDFKGGRLAIAGSIECLP